MAMHSGTEIQMTPNVDPTSTTAAMLLGRPAGSTRSAAVDALLATAVANGATLQKPAHEAFWGGYSGYFLDPDGHPWEVAYNPFVAMGPNGELLLPD
jgi:uncharacterized glyoxalase superfamily protein PhnB